VKVSIRGIGFCPSSFLVGRTHKLPNTTRREGWVQRGSVDLHYLEWNAEAAEQPALFLLHGLSSNARIWDRMAQHLDRRLIALDQRAHGRSPLPPAGFGIDGFAADAVAAITRLGLGRPVLAGHSWGGAVALQVAATHPELASGLAIVAFPAQPFPRPAGARARRSGYVTNKAA